MNTRTKTYAALLRPTGTWATRAYDLSVVIGGSLIVALAAQITIRLPFSPVPITGQTLAVLLVGMLLGSRRGAMSLLAYLAEGLIGLPVFAGGASGWAYVLGPTGGYLLGFIAAAFMAGWLAERGWDRHAGTAVLAMLTGNAVLYAGGLAWLAIYAPPQSVLPWGMLALMVGDAAKLLLAAAVLPLGWRVIERRS